MHTLASLANISTPHCACECSKDLEGLPKYFHRGVSQASQVMKVLKACILLTSCSVATRQNIGFCNVLFFFPQRVLAGMLSSRVRGARGAFRAEATTWQALVRQTLLQRKLARQSSVCMVASSVCTIYKSKSIFSDCASNHGHDLRSLLG
jgi:hypothetical protein